MTTLLRIVIAIAIGIAFFKLSWPIFVILLVTALITNYVMDRRSGSEHRISIPPMPAPYENKHV
jgi:hypothetical protein